MASVCVCLCCEFLNVNSNRKQFKYLFFAAFFNGRRTQPRREWINPDAIFTFQHIQIWHVWYVIVCICVWVVTDWVCANRDKYNNFSFLFLSDRLPFQCLSVCLFRASFCFFLSCILRRIVARNCTICCILFDRFRNKAQTWTRT